MAINYCSSMLLTFLFLAACEVNIKSYRIKQAFNITCDPQNSKCQRDHQIESLEKIAANVTEEADVQIDIKISELKLNGKLSFANLTSLTINGEPGLTTITCTTGGNSSAGIMLSHIKDKIVLNNLNIKFCGSQVGAKFDSDYYKVYTSALTIVHCKNIELNGVIIARSMGIGLTVLNHQGGEVIIKATTFKQNELPREYIKKSHFGGSGVYILVSRFLQSPYSPMSFQFSNCTFESNKALQVALY